jgi:membrane protease YdiL (CAAX protease family)
MSGRAATPAAPGQPGHRRPHAGRRGPRTPLAAFFALAFGLSWACWIPAALLAGTSAPGTVGWLLAAGGAGPLLATLAVLAPRGQRAARAGWARRLRNLGGLVSPAGLLCVLLPLLVLSLALDGWAVTGGIDLPPPRAADVARLLLPTLLLGALPQELAWRGYALPAMLRGRDPLAPTLLLGLLWGAWQLPLFFVKGTYHAGIELPSVIALVFFVGLVSQSLLMTALYLATRCTWAAVLFHWLTVLGGEAWQLPVAAEMHRALWTLLAAGVVLLVKPPFGIRPAD